ncbi:Zinc finger protein ZPR1 [Merluccius polli]|uniref:Zinc finger protein ZPR1 n=1 Tax=Merluccius polli TaxID=89951 RepID=A0AA47M0Z7_MERPO|nr:Zinc finger protein ZPR1 [Merluccius polli]
MSGITTESVRGVGSLFRDLDADDEESQTTQMESMCMNCHENGTTRLLLSRIPFFREVILSSFHCDHCHWSDTEVQSAGRIQDQGVRYSVRVASRRDLDREVVRSDSAAVRIPELDFEVPAFTQKGSLSTVEGLLDRAVAALEQDQAARRDACPDVAARIEQFVARLRRLKAAQDPFTLVVEDVSGNSFVENPAAPQRDDAMTSMRDEVLVFPTNCPECNAPASTRMKLVQIPHFKEVVIMATNCDACGHRTNEVKSGGATEPLGTRITLRVTCAADVSRDVLKSETCRVLIPELEFELGMAMLGGKFTTLEGLLADVRDVVAAKNPFLCGDSGGAATTADRAAKLRRFAEQLDLIAAGGMVVHVVLDDPAGNSYVQNVYAPDPDPEMTVEKYERSHEQNEELGLNDMKTEGYEEERGEEEPSE